MRLKLGEIRRGICLRILRGLCTLFLCLFFGLFLIFGCLGNLKIFLPAGLFDLLEYFVMRDNFACRVFGQEIECDQILAQLEGQEGALKGGYRLTKASCERVLASAL